MKLTRRGRAAAGCTLALVAGGLVLAELALLLAAAGVAAWLLGAQAAFVGALRRERAELTTEIATPAGHPAVGGKTDVRLAATGRGGLPLRVSVDAPVAGRVVDGASGTDRSERTADPDRDRATVDLDARDGDDRVTADASIAVEWPIAGEFRVGPVRVEATDRRGLFTAAFATDASADVVVEPREPETTHLGLGDERVVAFGEHTTDRRGAGTEPVELRPYTTGDDVGRIDWNATARLQEAYVAEAEAETDRRTVLFVDHRATTALGPAGATAFDSLRYAALALVESARDLGDPLGCYAVGDGGVTLEHAPRATPGQYDAVADALRNLAPTSDPVPAEPTPTATAGAESDGGPATASGGAVAARTAPPIRRLPRHSGDPAEAALKAGRLAGEESAFATRLRPLLSDATPYLHRVADEPLFRAVRTYHRRLQGTVWSIVCSDGEHPGELREAVKLARRGRDRVLVVLAPAPLFREGPDDPADRRRDAEDVAEFARSLSALEGVTVRVVGPGDRVERILSQGGERR